MNMAKYYNVPVLASKIDAFSNLGVDLVNFSKPVDFISALQNIKKSQTLSYMYFSWGKFVSNLSKILYP